MKLVNVKGMIAKVMMVGLAAGALAAVSAASAQAQQFVVGAQFGAPGYVVDHDGYRYDYRRAEYREQRAREEYREREAREDFARREAYLRHEQWDHQRHFDRDYR